MRTLAVRTIEGGTGVVVIGRSAPSDEDWNVLVELNRKDAHKCAIIVTAGGAPTAKQRRAILDASGGKGVPAAVLTDSAVVRGIATAISWFVPEMRAFSPSDLQGALDHLKVTTPVAQIQKVIDELVREIADAARVDKAS